MATLLLLDSLPCGAHGDSSATAGLCSRSDLSFPISKPPSSRSSPPGSGKVTLESSLFGSRDGKLQLDQKQAVLESTQSQTPTIRCASLPSVDVLDPLHRLVPSSDEAIRPRPGRTRTSVRRPAEWDKASRSLASDRDGGIVSSPLFLSTSQTSQFSRRQAISNGAAVQMVAAIPARSARSFKGGVGGVCMGFAALILGITALLQRGGLFGHSHTTICSTCRGYGITPCFICGGRGNVQWEGKLKRADPCPLCFGSCTAKCSSCGGIRVYKGVPPFQQQLSRGSGN